ncbi:P-loop containing nucleoside triphosphate hydrolase protein, partial [Mycena pura]
YVLYGLGGVGKTQIGLKFAELRATSFSSIFLIDASTVQTIDTGLKNIAVTVTRNLGKTAQDALQWLASKRENWLLFFDNADDPKLNLNDFFPCCGHGNIVITSRNPGLRVYAGAFTHVSDMEEVEAVELLLKGAAVQDPTPRNTSTAADIVKVLSCLPLAIIQAGAFIAKSGSLDGYLELFRANQARLLSEKPVQAHDDYAWTVYTTWKISFDRLSQPAARLLQLCSLLHHQGISEDVFRNASMYTISLTADDLELEEASKFLSQFKSPAGTWDSFRFQELTNEIQAYSLITFDPEQELFSIHPLVHAWSQSALADRAACHACISAIAGMAISTIPVHAIKLASLRWAPHVDVLLRSGSGGGLQQFHHRYAEIYMYAERYRDAKQLQVAVFERRQALLGEDHPDTLRARSDLAYSCHYLGQYKESETHYNVVLEGRKKLLGDRHPDTVETMGRLAVAYSKLGQLAEARELGITVLEQQRKILGDKHPDTLHSMGSLASTYYDLRRFGDAEALEVVVLRVREAHFGRDHPDVLRAMGNLASTYTAQGKMAEAEPLETLVLEKRTRLLGGDHLDTLRAMGNLATTYGSLRQWEKAQTLEVAVLEKRRKLLGEDHPDTVYAAANLAMTFFGQDQFDRAEELQRSVLERRRKLFGEEHPNTLTAMVDLAATYYSQSRWADAEELQLAVFQRRMRALGKTHPETLDAMNALADVYRRRGKFTEEADLRGLFRQR